MADLNPWSSLAGGCDGVSFDLRTPNMDGHPYWRRWIQVTRSVGRMSPPQSGVRLSWRRTLYCPCLLLAGRIDHGLDPVLPHRHFGPRQVMGEGAGDGLKILTCGSLRHCEAYCDRLIRKSDSASGRPVRPKVVSMSTWFLWLHWRSNIRSSLHVVGP